MNNNLVFLPENKEITAAEIWLPSRNENEAEAVCQFISSLPENISLEYLARGSKRSMLVRGNMQDVKMVGAMIAAAYPAASLHILENDPIREFATKENIVSGDYGFSGEGYLPLKHFERYKEYDPVHTILVNLVTFNLCRLRGSEAPIPHLNQVKPVPYEAGNERPRVLLSEQIQRFYSMMNR